MSEIALPPPPLGRFMAWNHLSTAARSDAMTNLGYAEETWNLLGSSPLESISYRYLTPMEAQSVANSMGISGPLAEATWDCWIAHYGGYEWMDLAGHNVQQWYIDLGWSEASWEGEVSVPESVSASWEELSDLEKRAAIFLCYDENSWDRLSLEPPVSRARSLTSTSEFDQNQETSALPIVEIVGQVFVLRQLETYLVFGRAADSVSGEGPYGFMPPWDNAFSRLDSALIVKLRGRPWGAHLQNLLLFHVFLGDLPIDTLGETQTVTMMNGEDAVVTRIDGTNRVRVNDVLVIAQYNATNGYAYMLDQVMTPAWVTRTLAEVPLLVEGATSFANLIATADIEALLRDPDENLTLFVPDENAINSIPFFVGLQLSINDALLRETLLSHAAIDGPYPSMYFVSRQLPSLSGRNLQLIHNGSVTTVQGSSNSATITIKDYQLANNGMIHMIDTVLLLP